MSDNTHTHFILKMKTKGIIVKIAVDLLPSCSDKIISLMVTVILQKTKKNLVSFRGGKGWEEDTVM